MERTEHKIEERVSYKEYSKAEFPGFSRNYPSSLRTVLEPEEFDNIIRTINSNSVRTKRTTGLKIWTYVGLILCPVFIGFPIFLVCEITNGVVFNRFYSKLKKNIEAVLSQINKSEICRARSIEFSLRTSPKTYVGRTYSIVVSFLKSPSGVAQQVTFLSFSESQVIQQQLLLQQQQEQQRQQQLNSKQNNYTNSVSGSKTNTSDSNIPIDK